MNKPKNKGEKIKNCSSCKFYLASAQICRRYPPIPVIGISSSDYAGRESSEYAMATEGREYTTWPEVASDDWCGEYRGQKSL